MIPAARRRNRNPNRRRILRVSPEELRRGESPLSSVLEFGQRGHGRWARPLGAAIAALLFHGAVGLIAGVRHAVSHEEPPPKPQQITVTVEKPLPPPPPPPPTPQRPPVARSPKIVRPTANKAPPAPAKAGKVVTAPPAPNPNEPIDMTGFNIAVGEGQSYAGGYSSAKGTSTDAIHNANARIGGKSNAVDQSRAAAPAHRDWACAWPAEEQTDDLRDARVTIRVHIDPDGLPTSVDILNAPPGGFAAAARRCAEGETYLVAHDSSGRPVASITPPFVVHFFR